MTEHIASELQQIVRGHIELDDIAHGPELRPLLPCGPRDAAICFVGRDPGKQEVKCGLPFVGESGQRLRNCLLEIYASSLVPNEKNWLAVGEQFFWLNTVPFKPKSNKPWSQGVRLACQPKILQLVREQWDGREVVAFGKEAFFWFGMGQSLAIRRKLRDHWNQGDARYEDGISTPAPGLGRTVHLYPMPHPSLANASWRKRFPELFKQRLLQIKNGQGVSWNKMEEQ